MSQVPKFVYFAQVSPFKPIKIGFSKNPIHRVRGLARGEHKGLRLIGVLDHKPRDPGEYCEHYVHYMFDDERIEGEWFRPSHRLKAFIREEAAIGPLLWDRLARIEQLASQRKEAKGSRKSVRYALAWDTPKELAKRYAIPPESAMRLLEAPGVRRMTLPGGEVLINIDDAERYVRGLISTQEDPSVGDGRNGQDEKQEDAQGFDGTV